MKVLSIIPAKENSIRLPKKNLRKIAGKSLLQYAISSSLKSSLINRTIVSTDSKKISRLSISLGAEVPFLRPKKISSKQSTNIDVIKHVLEFLQQEEDYTPDIVLLLQPTSPLRTTKMIDDAVKLLIHSDATSVISVKVMRINPYESFLYTEKYAKPWNKNYKLRKRKQKLPMLYYPTGAIYAFWHRTLEKYNSIYGPRIKPMIIPDELSIDIDIVFDLFVAEMVIQKWSKYKKRIS